MLVQDVTKIYRIILFRDTLRVCMKTWRKRRNHAISIVFISGWWLDGFSSCSQLLIFLRSVHSNDTKEEFLFCCALEIFTKSEDILEEIKTIFEVKGLQWENMCEVCVDGAPAMIATKCDLLTKRKELAPEAKCIHFMIHRYPIASKTIPAPLQVVLIGYLNC